MLLILLWYILIFLNKIHDLGECTTWAHTSTLCETRTRRARTTRAFTRDSSTDWQQSLVRVNYMYSEMHHARHVSLMPPRVTLSCLRVSLSHDTMCHSHASTHHSLMPPRVTLSCLHASLSHASTCHSLMPPRVTLACLHVSPYVDTSASSSGSSWWTCVTRLASTSGAPSCT